MKRPNWKIKFRTLPLIPETKHWINDGKTTEERIITEKLRQGQNISQNEINILNELKVFYNDLEKGLETLDYTTFTQKDFIDFKNYIKYVYNNIAILSNKFTIFHLYRVVKYSDNKTITHKKFLTYPPLHVVKKNGKFNRANTQNTTVFYGAETIDSTLNEIKDSINVGDLLTIGKWVPKSNKEFISYPISHSKPAYGKNLGTTKALHGLKEALKGTDEMFIEILERYFSILGKEYSKVISHNNEYFISATFSEDIFNNPQNKNTNFDIECIIYPSVGNKYQTSNFAFRRDVFRNNFTLEKVIEFEVTEKHFDRNLSKGFEEINLVSYKNLRTTTKFDDSSILW